MEPPVTKDRSNFYDGGVPAGDGQIEVPPNRDADLVVVLDRRLDPETGEEEFALLRRIAYDDRTFGQLLVPVRLDGFTSDLTSVPSLFTWLVPRTGTHLPAALLHDGMSFPNGEPPTFSAPEWDGDPITRVGADRVFRDAMADTGTGVVRRWLVWAAVATATMFRGEGTGWSNGERLRYRFAAGGTIGVIVLLGFLATFDLLDLAWAPELWWMGREHWVEDLLGGLAGAVVVPILLGLTWGRFRIAGWIAGILLAVLLPVTVVVGSGAGLYWLVERLVARAPVLARAAALLVVACAVILFLMFVLL